jgi:thiol-disulfide isomerase/thioredoxin
MNKGLLLSMGLLLIAFAYLAVTPPGPHPLLGTMATDLELELLEGGKFRLSDHLGSQVVVLDFWASWCGPCRVTMPIIEKLVNEYDESDVILYTINMAENPDEVRAFLRDAGVDVRVGLDPWFQAARAYDASALPQTVIIDKEGVIQAVHVGVDHNLSEELRVQLDTLLAGDSLVEKRATEPVEGEPRMDTNRHEL